MNTELYELFSYFLNSTGCRGKFIINMARDESNLQKNIHTLEGYCMSVTKECDWIDQAFWWKLTPEGEDYWDELNTLWIRGVEGFYTEIPKETNEKEKLWNQIVEEAIEYGPYKVKMIELETLKDILFPPDIRTVNLKEDE